MVPRLPCSVCTEILAAVPEFFLRASLITSSQDRVSPLVGIAVLLDSLLLSVAPMESAALSPAFDRQQCNKCTPLRPT